jgi:hypothetical protein
MATTTMDTPRAAAFRPELAGVVGTGSATPGWDRGTERRVDDGETLARQMGWFSFALGATEVLFAERIAEWLGVDDHAGLIRLYGFREIARGWGSSRTARPPSGSGGASRATRWTGLAGRRAGQRRVQEGERAGGHRRGGGRHGARRGVRPAAEREPARLTGGEDGETGTAAAPRGERRRPRADVSVGRRTEPGGWE